MHHHAVRHGRGTCRQRLGRFFDIDQAHAAIRSNRELLVITEVWDVHAKLVGCVHHHAALRHFYRGAVDCKFYHYRYSGTTHFLCSMWWANSSRKCLMKLLTGMAAASPRSEERRVGKECRARWSQEQ